MPQQAINIRHLTTAALVAAVLATVAAPAAHAEDAEDAEDAEFRGAVAPTKTSSHWGLGLGVGTEHGLYKGINSRTTAIPLLLYDNEYVHVFGNSVDLKLPSVDNFHFALRAKYALGSGYKASDSSYLTGMAERKGSFWLGGAATWKTDALTLSAQWLKASGASKGQQFELGAEHAFRFGRLQLIPHVGVEWSDSKYVDYYYGVQASEATAQRPAYIGNAATDVSAGLRINYALQANQLILLDIADTHRGKNISNSPLVEKTTTPALRIGYMYKF
jgi:outer membrane protein